MTPSALSIETSAAETGAAVDEPIVPAAPLDMSWLKPVWLRPYLLVTVLAVHVAIFGIFLIALQDDATPMQEVQVTVIPQGEAVTEVSAVSAPQTAPIASPDPPVDSAPEIADKNDPDISKPSAAEVTPEVAPLLSAELPKVEQSDAPPLAVAKPDTPRTEKPTPAPAIKILQVLHKKKQQKAARQAAMRAKRLADARAHAKQQAADFSEGAEARHAGVRDGSDPSARMSEAAYAGLVSAELARHKIYPAEARAEGAQGRVGVVLNIGPSGAILSHSITHSSGNSAIDAAVHQIVASSHPPPPPGGSFRGSVGINFNLAR
ncbi:TonB family protein [Methyloferula stellata]|uniref:TonB family protein n=1 Tax=Methyloferula stellata TaxID=876270 RepID=UPI00037C7894|nr:TonB family protein [Methyloferula stellata]